MRHLCLTALYCMFTLTHLAAAEQKFPYRAQVITDRVEVRCGPGANFYVTGLVEQGDVVTVNRHDHGGWFMVTPPKGSISWIDADLVKRSGDRGTVQVAPQNGRPARAIVRIGSQISDDHAYYGRELSNGDEVTILGEKTLQTARGPVRMYKIVPPPQEFRWLKGEFLVPADDTVRAQIANDPYQIPAEHRPAFVQKKQEQQESVAKAEEREHQRKQLLYQELDRIDRLYAGMMQKEPKHWDLGSIEDQYKKLGTGADETIQTLIQKRLSVLDRRREILSHYQNFIQVSAESARRDQALVAQQLGTPANPFDRDLTANMGAPSIPGTTLDNSVTPRINGAGVIQQMANYPGGPQYALVAPNGRLLSFLELGEGVRISEWIGKPAGIIGNRQFDPQVGADVIRVQRVVPVRLIE